MAALLLAACAFLLHAPGLFFGQHRQVLLDGHDSTSAATRADVDSSIEGATNETLLYPALGQVQAAAQKPGAGFPLWNRNARFGEPFSATGAPVWYPPYWLLTVGEGPWRYDLLLALHSVVACLAMFRFLRVMPLSRFVAFIGGASYGMGWFLTANLDRLPEAAAAALLPVALECTWRCLSQRRCSRMFVPILGVAITMMFATGSTTTAWLGTGLCVAAVLAGLGAVEREHRTIALRMLGAGLLCAGLLTAPLWLDWLQHAGSLEAAAAEASGRTPRLQLLGLANLLAPGLGLDLRGHGLGPLDGVASGADPLELVLYPGALVAFASLLGLFRPKRTLQGLFWVGVAGTGLLLTVESPLHDWIHWAPDRPGAALVLFHLGLVVIGAISLETFFDAPIARRIGTRIASGFAIASAVAVLLLGLALPGWGDTVVGFLAEDASAGEIGAARAHVFARLLAPAIALAAIGIAFCTWRHLGILRFKPILGFLAILDLAIPAWTLVPAGPGIDGPASVDHVLSQLPLDARRTRAIGVGRAPHAATPPAGWVASGGQPCVHTTGTAVLARTADFLAAVDPSCVQLDANRTRIAPLVFPGLLDDPLLTLAGVHVAIAATPTASDTFRPALSAPGLESDADGFVLFDAHAGSPPGRARLVYRVDHAESPADASHGMRTHALGAADSVVLEGRPREFDPKAPHEPIPIEWVSDEAHRIHLRARMGTARGYLVLADAFAPGWEATIDGEPTEVLPGDVAFRTIPLREGDHDVVFRYRPWSFYLGVPLALLGLLLGVAYYVWSMRGSRRAPGSA